VSVAAATPERQPLGLLMVGTFLSAHIGTRSVCEDLAERLQASGPYRVLTTSSRPNRATRLLEMVSTVFLRRHDFDVAQVDVYSGPAFIWAEAACEALRACRKPYVLSLHGGNQPRFSRRWPGRVRRLLRSAAAVTTPSRYLLEQMRDYRSDLTLLPNPIDLDAYHFRVRHAPQPRLVWLRALHGIYNLDMAVRALRLIANDFPRATLSVIGPDKRDGSGEQARRLATTLEVGDRIDWVGRVAKADVPARLECGDIFLNTTNVDNTPVSVIEAMASGLCIVSTNVDGLPYLLQDEEDALLVPTNDHHAMASAVRRILTEPVLAARLSRNARANAARFDWAVVLPQWQALLRKVSLVR
jgi:glycosyltransferase involved in cell wall biosynthesis